ncbi:hypothetical protein Q5P01_003046 [Channa striata]|uniref:C-type lectin domain-containing protein n=1 Tax=Channa striata TaxID=64152 RepID=A0AA88P2B7_CHASR|nr:hypothetical protein Q5P01_003046 [Channa striata]
MAVPSGLEVFNPRSTLWKEYLPPAFVLLGGSKPISSFSIRAPRMSSAGVSRFLRWLLPALAAVVILVLIIVVGSSSTKMSNRLWSVEQSVSNLSSVIQSLNTSLQQAQEKVKEVQKLQFSVENNKNQLITVSEALQQLSKVDSLSKSIASLKCSLEHFIRNSSTTEGSHLLILRTDKEWDFVTHRSIPDSFWVGLTDGRTGKWEWVNRTPYIMERRHWKPGQPDSWTGHGLQGNEDCAEMNVNGRLNDLHCSTKRRYICQKHSLPTETSWPARHGST